MRRLDDLRVDSFQQQPSWQGEGSYTERRGTMDDIDYMSDEEEGSLHDVSGSDTTRGASHAGRSASAAIIAPHAAAFVLWSMKMQGASCVCPCRHVPFVSCGPVSLPAAFHQDHS